MRLLITTIFFGLLCISTASASGYYGYKKMYSVSITNISKGVYFTPTLVATHKRSIKVFSLGEPASSELIEIAEGGNIAPLNDLLSNSNAVHMTASTTGLLGPGQTTEIEISGSHHFNRLSLAAMLLPTNDTFYALNSVSLPRRGTRTYLARAYDAGSETNDELCISIPGPMCGGEPGSPNDPGEGYIYTSPGIHGQGDLSTAAYQWQNPVAKIVVTRIH